MKRAVLLLVPLLVSCGGGSSNSAAPVAAESDTSAISKAYDTLSLVPTCTAELESQLVFIKDAQEFRYCDAGNWVVAEPKQQELEITSRTMCGLRLSQSALAAEGLDSVPADGLYFSYISSKFSTGLVFVEFQIVDDEVSYSASAFYAASASGAETESSDLIVLDVHGLNGGGFWKFSKTESDHYITYYDSELSGSTEKSYLVPSGKCETTTY